MHHSALGEGGVGRDRMLLRPRLGPRLANLQKRFRKAPSTSSRFLEQLEGRELPEKQ